MAKSKKSKKKETEQVKSNADILKEELKWLGQVINQKLDVYLDQLNKTDIQEIDVPQVEDLGLFYTDFVKKYQLTKEERLVILLALAPEIQPEVLDPFLLNNRGVDKSFTEFGGFVSATFKGFLPTIKTALFLLGSSDLNDQMKYNYLFDKSSKLCQMDLLKEIDNNKNDPKNNKMLCLSDNAFNNIVMGDDVHHEYSKEFPANELKTQMEWDDLVLSEPTQKAMKELLAWLDHGDKLFDELNLGKNVQPGYRALFYGPPGTGKTLTTALIGKKVGKPVYRIDLSQMVSKYVGETEKNLEKIFKTAEQQDWILFFDEADALFGKRTGINTSNDRFANQETAYLLQRIEAYPEIVILASNMKKNLDEAFTRRFQSVVYFPMPEKEDRLRLWNGVFSEGLVLDDQINLEKIARDYDMAGGSIVNVIRYCSLMALSNNTVFISKKTLMEGISREYQKIGRTV